MTIVEPVDVDAVALAVADVLAVLSPEPRIRSASVSEVYLTNWRTLDRKWWRCCVEINGLHVFQPRFVNREDAVWRVRFYAGHSGARRPRVNFWRMGEHRGVAVRRFRDVREQRVLGVQWRRGRRL